VSELNEYEKPVILIEKSLSGKVTVSPPPKASEEHAPVKKRRDRIVNFYDL